mmetsp:Transcript_3264/g.4771  ORF Transcript_3264/g.4771 Transcript_3264/m.4771 type:complete len:83 (+) Transcript_3264:149-397(+)
MSFDQVLIFVALMVACVTTVLAGEPTADNVVERVHDSQRTSYLVFAVSCFLISGCCLFTGFGIRIYCNKQKNRKSGFDPSII